ncbi:PREDICTED: mannose-6-phosphate isomerase 1-like isoform X2 [Tarenaya hassleriana]|uniref:mannose-6-phosphate isomerase 1-like isoform X1 n=1 Tax=Tarenaya hassleriana TaxID=28532 RepID=UPI00053C1918|nr:PREDICTED: mannose-6-phosphate isomerase 1-like isoform X1 [Tarenaya hassleriana]XP_010532338.1 PREDICTED: mannose-6-phosphate isomerase 1-like isoform X2 [Tarenaya hassleriana]
MTKWTPKEPRRNGLGGGNVDGDAVSGGLVRLRCSVQNYDWGIEGHDSQVARLFSLNSGSGIDPLKPYAELWIGTHESGPSFVVDRDGDNNGGDVGVVGLGSVSLKSWISTNPNVLGHKVARKWGNDLPFLFKVLSVQNALSIQVHPDKEWARILHKSRPSVYKDDNYKPEMALAITEFEALCGFISTKELREVLLTIPEIVELIGLENTEKVLCMKEQEKDQEAKSILEFIFAKILVSSQERISDTITKLKRRLQTEKKKRLLSDKEQLVLKLERQYPTDTGILAAFLLNYVKLNRGEALYLGPNEPHAYIRGECVECMATSDNVVRAGLTSKYRDTKTLLSMLTYKQGFPEILRGIPLNRHTKRYLPPFEEFEVDRCILGEAEWTVFPSVAGPSLFICLTGQGTMESDEGHRPETLGEGDVLFVAANVQVRVTAESREMELYRAGVSSRCFQASS